MMKILCPTDFSEVASSGIEYAARLAQQLSARLTLLNVQKMNIGEGVTMFAGGERESLRNAVDSELALRKICAEVEKTFKIPCDEEVIPAFDSLAGVIADLERNYDLIVVATNGSDSFFPFDTGTNSYRITEKVKAPVLIVPNNYQFEPIHKLVYATDYSKDDREFVVQLRIFLQSFRPQIELVHLSSSESVVGKELFRSFSDYLDESLGYDSRLTFKRLITDDFPKQLRSEVDQSNAGLLVLSYVPHNFIYKLTSKSLIKEMIADLPVPLLVFHK
jgi:nucleotide-binding universal stress UspA family protein